MLFVKNCSIFHMNVWMFMHFVEGIAQAKFLFLFLLTIPCCTDKVGWFNIFSVVRMNLTSSIFRLKV